MSWLVDAFKLSQRVSVAAKEEAGRLGDPRIDVDHLFLALLIDPGSAGVVLRSFEITLDDARHAAQVTQAELLAGLGITSPPLDPRPLLDPSIGDVDFTPRAIAVLSNLQDYSSDLPLLEALLDEPSGLVARVVERLGVSEAELRAAIAQQSASARPAPVVPLPTDPEWLTLTQTGFVPAPPAEVWALVSDPSRRPEWDSLVRSAFVRSHQRVVAREPDTSVEWETSWPDRARSATVRQCIQVAAAVGGTQIELTLALRRRTGVRLRCNDSWPRANGSSCDSCCWPRRRASRACCDRSNHDQEVRPHPRGKHGAVGFARAWSVCRRHPAVDWHRRSGVQCGDRGHPAGGGQHVDESPR